MQIRARALLGLTLILGLLLTALATPARATDPIDILAQRGFGDRQNNYAWSMAWFKGKLYVGTGRNVYCVENLTTEYYFPVANRYESNPLPGVRCTRDPWDLNLRAEIWQYTPRTGIWRRVYRSPDGTPNPRAPGKSIARDIAYRGMGVYRDRRGREALFVAGVTSDEYVPELAKRYPPRLLRTTDGVHFRNVGAPALVRRSGEFTDHRPIGFRSILTWKHRLFVTASAGLLGDGAIFRVDHPWARHARFRQVSPRTMTVFEMETFNGALYAGLGDFKDGYAVWRTRSVHAPFRFKPVVRHGAGREGVMTSVVAMKAFRDHLYVSAAGWAHLTHDTPYPSSELIRIGRDGKWSVVAGNTRQTADGRIRQPISGLRDGFENIFNAHMWRMLNADGALYVGTLDWSWLVQTNKEWAGPLSGVATSALAGELGFDVWASCDGRDWFPVTRNAFGIGPYDMGVRNMVGGRNGFYVGSANQALGTTILRDSRPACAPLIKTRARARAATSAARAASPRRVVAPRQMLTDVQRHGTVVSWERSPGMRYQVQRAQFLQIPLSFAVPPALPGGFRFDDAVPVPVAPGTPGAVDATLPVLGAFEPVGTTTKSFFVDRSAPQGRYAYQVIARGRAGATARSNVQVVPDPRPVPTFRQLERALPRERATTDALVRWRRGDRTGALSELSGLRRSRARDDAGELAYRLKRRLQYANVAGGA